MNRERAKELLPVLEAFVNGDDIQFRPYQYNPTIEDTPGWSDLPKDERVTMTFPCDDYEYRIKPKAHEGFVHIDDFHTGCHGKKDCIKVREVLE